MLKITCGNDLIDGLVELVGHESDEAEDDEAGEEGGGAIGEANDDGVAEAVVGELVVAGQGDEAAPARAQGEEDLDGRVGPDLHDKKQF